MTRRGTLSGMLGAYLYAALLVAGPWIFTVLGLLSLSAAHCDGSCADLTVFRSIVIYNSMYALIVTSPLAFVTGRYASEQMERGRDAQRLLRRRRVARTLRRHVACDRRAVLRLRHNARARGGGRRASSTRC